MKLHRTLKKIVPAFFVMLFLLGNSGCEEASPSAETKQKRQTDRLQKEADSRLGMPNIINFTEKRFSKMLLELRDKETTTYSYIVDMHGTLHLICKSIGYGMPYSVQYTNPQKVVEDSWGNIALPQADPNGLYMPQGLSATFVMCIDKQGDIKPVYVEPELIVSPFKLQ